MSLIFADTSALTKRYINEAGTSAVQAILDNQHHLITISELTPLEFASTLIRLNRTAFLTAKQYSQLYGAFKAHELAQYLVVGIEPAIMSRARQFVEQGTLRPADAIQLTTALYVNALLNEPVVFMCADGELNQAAQAAGLDVLDPTVTPPPTTLS
jgi:predicted nucleic acid-binding protein